MSQPLTQYLSLRLLIRKRRLGVAYLCLPIFALWPGCLVAATFQGGNVSVKGRVVTENGEPVQGAKVYLAILDRAPPAREPTVKTGKGGVFEIQTAPGTYAIHAFKEEDGYPDSIFAFSLAPGWEIPRVVVSPGQNVDAAEVRLGPKPAVLHLTVVDAHTGETLGGVEYKLCQVLRPTYCISSTAPAVYSFSAPPTAISIEVSAKGYVKARYEGNGKAFVEVAAGEERNLLVRLTPQ